MSEIVDALENLREVWDEGPGHIAQLERWLESIGVAIDGALAAAGQDGLNPVRVRDLNIKEPFPPDAELDDELELLVEHALNVWDGRFTYHTDREWLDEMDGAIKDLAVEMGRVGFDSPIFGKRGVIALEPIAWGDK